MKTGYILLDRYQICQELSYKTVRRTYLAQDIHSQTLVIVKMLLLDRDFQWDELKLFEREAKTLQNLEHPAIPKYLDYFELEIENTHSFVLVQNYIDAPSLEALVRDGRKFSEFELIELAEQMLDILVYLHGQNPPVIHRDIKPSNILLTNRSGNSIGNLYLVDFGSVQTVASKDSGTITIVGSYGYIPLEQFSGKTKAASDLYSLGMTIIYLITGVQPAELPQINGKVQFESGDINKKFLKWLDCMTHPYLDRRFDSAKLALTTLISEDGTYGDYLPMKPTGSYIELHCNRDSLEIIVPKRRHLINLKFYHLCLFLPMIIIRFGWVAVIPGLIFLSSALPLLVSIIDRIANLFPSLRSRLLYYSILSIDRDSGIRIGTRKNRTQDITWEKSSPFQEINLLAYNPGYKFTKFLNNRGQEVNTDQTVEVPKKLYIYAGDTEYEVGNAQLSEAELWWLGKNLSDFLDLEMAIIYPTPKTPREFTCGGC